MRFAKADVLILDDWGLAPLGDQQRRDLLEVLEDSIAAASQEGYAFWTDDRVLSFLGEEYFGVQRVWTQAVLAWLADRNVLSAEAYRQASARRHAFQYTGTMLDAGVVLEAARLANWSVVNPLLGRCLELLAAPTTRPDVCVAMAATLIRGGVIEAALPVTQTTVVTSVMERVADRDRSLRIADAVRTVAISSLRLAPGPAERAQATIDDWFRTYQRPVE